MHLPFDAAVLVAALLDCPGLCQLRLVSQGWRDAADYALRRQAAATPAHAFGSVTSPLLARELVAAHGWKAVTEFFAVRYTVNARQKLHLLAAIRGEPLPPTAEKAAWLLRKAFWQMRDPHLTRLVLQSSTIRPSLGAERLTACLDGDWPLVRALFTVPASRRGALSWLREGTAARLFWYYWRPIAALLGALSRPRSHRKADPAKGVTAQWFLRPLARLAQKMGLGFGAA